jgi:mycothiol synthase
VTTAPAIEATELTDRQASQIDALVAAAPDSNDNPPLNERTLLHLTSGAPFRHFIVTSGDTITGYAQIDSTLSPSSAELVTITPGGEAIADALMHAIEEADPSLRLWAHGESSAAAGAASRAGWVPVRTLLQLRRSLEDIALPDELPPDVRIRPFVPGVDDEAWLRVNARAFATHPEQGQWTQADLDERMASAWFDPLGFLVADRVGPDGTVDLIGYHWTKVHHDMNPPAGEVYVLGLDPSAQGMGLGQALLLAGLLYLRHRGLNSVLLYVEAENAPALKIYLKAGFEPHSRDTQYAPPFG